MEGVSLIRLLALALLITLGSAATAEEAAVVTARDTRWLAAFRR